MRLIEEDITRREHSAVNSASYGDPERMEAFAEPGVFAGALLLALLAAAAFA